MTTRISSLGIRNIGFLLLGIILLAVGLFASLYHVMKMVGKPPLLVEQQIVYPYLSVGVIFLLAGIIFIAMGFLYSPQKPRPLSAPS